MRFIIFAINIRKLQVFEKRNLIFNIQLINENYYLKISRCSFNILIRFSPLISTVERNICPCVHEKSMCVSYVIHIKYTRVPGFALNINHLIRRLTNKLYAQTHGQVPQQHFPRNSRYVNYYLLKTIICFLTLERVQRFQAQLARILTPND